MMKPYIKGIPRCIYEHIHPRLRLVYIYPPQQIKNLQYIHILYVCMYPYCIYSNQHCVQHL